MKSTERYWLRLGDAGEYEDYGHELGALIDMLDAAGVRPPFQWTKGGRFVGFTSGNDVDVSCFVGDRRGNLVRSLSKFEKHVVTSSVGTARSEAVEIKRAVDCLLKEALTARRVKATDNRPARA